MLYLLYTLFTLIFIYYQKYQFMDSNKVDVLKAKKMWHILGLCLRLFVVLIILAISIFNIKIIWQDILLLGVINALVWEIGINKIALNTDWFHIGTTSSIDKALGKYKWKILLTSLIVSIVIKIFI